MWDNGDKVWEHHKEGILATDANTAKLLHEYLKFVRISRSYAQHMEIIDLQRYKVERNARKVKQALGDGQHKEPFIFIQYLN